MNKLNFKKQILEEGRKKHNSVIYDFNARMQELLKNVSKINADKYDLQQQSLSAEASRKLLRLSEQFQFAEKELQIINNIRIDKTLQQRVGPGSVVVTDKKTFFVSASIEKFYVEGKEIFGLSLESPLYKQMQGKKKGDDFTCRGDHYHIKDTF